MQFPVLILVAMLAGGVNVTPDRFDLHFSELVTEGDLVLVSPVVVEACPIMAPCEYEARLEFVGPSGFESVAIGDYWSRDAVLETYRIERIRIRSTGTFIVHADFPVKIRVIH